MNCSAGPEKFQPFSQKKAHYLAETPSEAEKRRRMQWGYSGKRIQMRRGMGYLPERAIWGPAFLQFHISLHLIIIKNGCSFCFADLKTAPGREEGEQP